MQYFIAGFLAILGLIMKKTKVIYGVIFTFMWMLFGWNLWNADYYGYEQTYYSIGIYNGFNDYFNQFEVGYRLFSKFMFSIGLDYNQFLIIYSLIGLLLIGSTIIKYTSKPTYVLALYFIYPFLMDIVQIRNFMAMAIIIYGIRYLFSSKKSDQFLYICFVLLAASFQSVGLFYLILLLAKIENLKKLIKWVVLITLFLILFLFIIKSGYPIPIIGSVSYFSSKTSFITRLAYLIYFIIGFRLAKFSYTVMNSKNLIGDSKNSSKEDSMVKIIYKMNIIILCVYPLLFFSVDFIRLYRNIFPINYILFSIALTKSKKNYLFQIVILAFVFLSEWLFAYYMSGKEVFYPIFEQNRIFEILKQMKF